VLLEILEHREDQELLVPLEFKDQEVLLDQLDLLAIVELVVNQE